MEKEKDVIEVIAEEPAEEASKKRLSDKSLSIAASAIALAVIIAAPIIGFSVPKSERAIEKSLASLEKRDTKFLNARDTKLEAEQEQQALLEKLSDKQKELEEFHKSQDNLDKITESNASLEAQKKQLQNDIAEKKSKLSSLEASVNARSNKMVTWASGDYTVGKDIAAGKYTITGSGSIAIANSGKSLANKLLKADGESFVLNSGDRIHIDGSAKLSPQ